MSGRPAVPGSMHPLSAESAEALSVSPAPLAELSRQARPTGLASSLSCLRAQRLETSPSTTPGPPDADRHTVVISVLTQLQTMCHGRLKPPEHLSAPCACLTPQGSTPLPAWLRPQQPRFSAAHRSFTPTSGLKSRQSLPHCRPRVPPLLTSLQPDHLPLTCLLPQPCS